MFNASVYAKNYSGNYLNSTDAEITEKFGVSSLVVSDKVTESNSTTVQEDLRTPSVEAGGLGLIMTDKTVQIVNSGKLEVD